MSKCSMVICIIIRMQLVCVDGESSVPTSFTSGVPQGTVLGPLMFLLYINDIGQELDSDTKIKFFPDDALLYLEINSPEDHQE